MTDQKEKEFDIYKGMFETMKKVAAEAKSWSPERRRAAEESIRVIESRYIKE